MYIFNIEFVFIRLIISITLMDGIDLDRLAGVFIREFRRDMELSGKGYDTICLTGANGEILRGLQDRMQFAALEGGLNGVKVYGEINEKAIKGADRSYILRVDSIISLKDFSSS